MTILTLQALREAVAHKRTDTPNLGFDEAVEAVAHDLHLTVDLVLRAFRVEVKEVTE